jgi:hypothetical protein
MPRRAILGNLRNKWSQLLNRLQASKGWNMKGLATRKVILYGTNFSIGLILGYALGLLKLHKIFLRQLPTINLNISRTAWSSITSIFSWFRDFFDWFSPNVGFLSDIVAFQSAVIAIAIPLSIEIVSRISERYQSGVITRKFKQQWQIKLLQILLITDIIIAVFLKFFISNDPISEPWKALAWIAFVIFLITAFILYKFFHILQSYVTDTTFLLNQLFDDMGKLLDFKPEKKQLNNKILSLKQTRFIDALEGTGDILVFETKNKKGSKDIISGLERIREKIKQFFDIQKERPEKFERLLLSQEFFSLYENNQTEAQLRLAFDSKTHLVSFTAAVNQLLRIREAATEAKNVEISRFATYHLISLLIDISQMPKNNLLAEQLLQNLADIRRNTSQYQDESAYTVSISWYLNGVFNNLFDLSYLELFDRYFFSCIRDIVSNSQTVLFQGLVSTLINSGQLMHHSDRDIESYAELLIRSSSQKYDELNQNYKIENKLAHLKKLSQTIRTKEKLDSWLNKLNEVERVLEPNFDEEQKQQPKEIGESIREASVFNFKFNHLQDIIFAAGAYCIFKQRFEYIKYLWNYKQPPDSDAIWIGHDIVPSTLEGLILFYFGQSIFERIPSLIWEEHHGSEIYYKRYFLLLLLRELQKHSTVSNNDKYEMLNNVRLPDTLGSYRLNDIRHSVDSFVELAKKIQEDTNSLRILGFDIARLTEDIEAGLIPFLESLKPKVEERLKSLKKAQSISIKKIEDFKETFIENFNNSTVIRNIIAYLNLYEDKIHEEYASKMDSLA